MATIAAKDVAELRRQTGCGMMDCKNALVEAEGDFDRAIKILREKGMAATAKKAGRIAAEGIVAVKTAGDLTAMVEVNSETDFVAKNASFQEFVSGILDAILANKPADVDALLACKYNAENTVETELQEKTYTIGEKLSIRRFVIVEGVTATYVHGIGVTGVVAKFDVDPAVAERAEFKEFAKNITLQIAAYNIPYLAKEDVPASVLAEEKEIVMTQMKQDPKMANKPEKVLEGIVAGKMKKYYENNCVLEQAYVKDDSMTVSQYVAATAKALGAPIKVVSFVRYEKGEGIQKREDDLAAEVAKMVGGNH